jgi:CheY-like chemotaxis protein
MRPSDLSVLIVDDQADVREALAGSLEQSGYRIDTAENGHAALELLRANHYDLVLSDIHMPQMNGMGLYHRLRELRPALAPRFIVVTGGALGGVIAAFLDETGLPCLEKPFAPAEVRQLAAATVGLADR